MRMLSVDRGWRPGGVLLAPGAYLPWVQSPASPSECRAICEMAAGRLCVSRAANGSTYYMRYITHYCTPYTRQQGTRLALQQPASPSRTPLTRFSLSNPLRPPLPLPLPLPMLSCPVITCVSSDCTTEQQQHAHSYMRA